MPRERRGKSLVPAAMLLVNCRGVAARMKVQGIEQVALCGRVRGIQLGGVSITCQRFIQASLISENAAEVVMRNGKIGPELKRLPISINRIVRSRLLLKNGAERVVRMKKIRLNFQRAAITSE